MKRKIINIDETKCNGCGLCIPGCKEGALQIVNGKARLVKDSYCDGLGACLGECPQGALTIEERDTDLFDEVAVQAHLNGTPGHGHSMSPSQGNGHDFGPGNGHDGHGKADGHDRSQGQGHGHGGGCPGSAMRMMNRGTIESPSKAVSATDGTSSPSALGHWPVQLMLVPPGAPFLKEADLVICADCVPFAFPDLHSVYLKGRAVLVGCPKLDDLSYYAEKLTDLFREAKPRRITVLRMEVPCCGGIAQVAINAHKVSCPSVPLEVHTIGIQGEIVNRQFS
ncbi:MAG: 4Fe-4S binding protein [Candidatus Ozemobacteraceae bacterium]